MLTYRFLVALLLPLTTTLANPAIAPEAWAKVVPGVTESDVAQWLGAPLSSVGVQGESRKCYAILAGPTPLVPAPQAFCVFFKNGKVVQKLDPWGGGASVDGVPSVPVPLVPYMNQKMKHYPRWVDLRWHPSAGEGPIKYSIEVEVGMPGSSPNWSSFRNGRLESESPYVAFAHPGSQPGRWRVQARNAKGVSDWCEWQVFTFAQ